MVYSKRTPTIVLLLAIGCAAAPQPDEIAAVRVLASGNSTADSCTVLKKLEAVVDFAPGDPDHVLSDDEIWFGQIQDLRAETVRLLGDTLIVEAQLQSVGAGGGDSYWTVGYAALCPPQPERPADGPPYHKPLNLTDSWPSWERGSAAS
ncbi:MAG: hypothetical protein NXI18_21715 [Alphaproteobacteria bacterium]|nr:hypothetical protein [Alphaproteobacteria bacterium]